MLSFLPDLLLLFKFQGLCVGSGTRASPLLGNICGKEGHKSESFSDHNKHHLCHSEGHIAKDICQLSIKGTERPHMPFEIASLLGKTNTEKRWCLFLFCFFFFLKIGI